MAPISSQWSTEACGSGSVMRNCSCAHSQDTLWDYCLPITRRGLFFQDSSFEKARSQLEVAVQDILAKWGHKGLMTDKWDDVVSNNSLTHYRQLRAHNLKQEDQAAVFTSDNTDHKVSYLVTFHASRLIILVLCQQCYHINDYAAEQSE